MQIVVGIMVLMAPPMAEPAIGPTWHSDYGVALTETRQQRRPLLVVLEDRSNAEQQLEQVAFDSQWSATNDLKNYTLCRIDVSTDYGKRVAKAFRATQFPLTVIIDNRAQTILYSRAGQLSPTTWQAALQRNRSGQCFT